MGLRFRKSFKLPLGFRINLSKSGIGYSWGFPGYRITKKSSGGIRNTYSIPGTGISYVTESGKRTTNKKLEEIEPQIDSVTTYENIPTKEFEREDPIIRRLNLLFKINILSNILIIVSFLALINILFLISLLLALIIKTFINFNSVDLRYDFDSTGIEMYEALTEALIVLSHSRRLWQVNTSSRVINSKYHANAKNLIKRTKTFVTKDLPWFIKTNIDIYGIKLNDGIIYFAPDRMIIFNSKGKVFGTKYGDGSLGLSFSRFVENEAVPSDASVVDYSWQYSNKDGTMDLRFSRNRKYPVCKYGEFIIKKESINTVVQFSNFGTYETLGYFLKRFGKNYNSLFAVEVDAEDEEDGELQ